MRLPPALLALRLPVFRQARKAGWAGAAGGVLMLLALGAAWLGGGELDRREQALSEERAAILHRMAAADQPRLDGRARLAAWYAGFAATDALPARLQRIHELAEARGLRLERADSRSSIAGGTPLLRIALHFPATGRPEHLYGWLSDCLRDMPDLALASLSLQREAIGRGEVEADVRWALFLRLPQ
jgi:hypothetical protein